MRSFRSVLGLRAAAQALGIGLLLLVGASLVLRAHLFSSLDASLRDIAALESQHGADSRDGAFRFEPRQVALPGEPSSLHQSWAQVLSAEGVPGARSANLHEPLIVPQRALQAAREGRATFESHHWNAKTVRSVIYPLPPSQAVGSDRFLQVTASLAPLQATLANFVWMMAGMGIVATLLAWLVGWVTARRALTPAIALTAQAESIGVNELDRRVTLPGDYAEFSRMAGAFNALLERLERAVNGTRRFTSDASHELRAPLTVLRGELELALSRRRSVEEYDEVLCRCLDEVLRLVRLTDDLLVLTRIMGGVVGGKRNPVALDEVVERAVIKRAELAEGRGVALEMSGSAGLVSGDPDLLLRAVDGLVEHAIMASPQGSRVRVQLAADGSRSVLVTDAGPGLNAEEVSSVFQRFYRSNRPRSSSEESGLGLPIARAVALSHGGALEYVGNDPGASFRFSLPVSGG